MPRDYGKIRHRFWTGETGKELRKLGPECQVVAAYLISCGSSNMIGLYYLPLTLLAHETGIPFEGASKALRRVCETGFCRYDEAMEVVFVPHMAKEQIGESLSAGDKQRHGVIALLREYEKSNFLTEFLDIYREAFHLQDVQFKQAPSKPLASPFEAPSKPESREQDQGTESREQEEDCTEPGQTLSLVPPEPALLSFPCAKGETWNLTESTRAELAEAYPAVDVLACARRALEWCRANPKKVKTKARMRGWIGGTWCAREQDRGQGGQPAGNRWEERQQPTRSVIRER